MIRFKKFEQNEYAILIRNGKVVKAGVGMAVIYDTRLCGVLVMPTTAFNQSAAFDDIQSITDDFCGLFHLVSLLEPLAFIFHGANASISSGIVPIF